MKLSDDLPHKVYDKNAWTIKQLHKDLPYYGIGHVEKLANQKVAEGVWEKVCKREDGKMRNAYRRKKK